MLVLSRGDLESVLAPADVIEALEAALRLHGEGRAVVPPRSVAPVGDGVLLLMPAAWRPSGADAEEPDGLGAKVVTYFAGNRARGQPTIHATYLLMDGTTGQPLALLEGTFLTALRTGAASALAARHLARPDAGRIVCFGAGVQAGFQLRCLAAVVPLAGVAVVGRDPLRARQFAEAMGRELDVPVEVARDARAAVREADIVVCATTSSTPVLFGADLKPGAHVDAVGAFRPDAREVDTEVVRRARVVVDTYEGALGEAGDILIPLREGAVSREHIAAELAELVAGSRRGRGDAAEVTLFKSVGWALEDLAAARLAYGRARARGIGTEVRL
ncbi:MAG: ornithine cyclodeaminase family protein [Candidatus Rokubacteria bacterium]|nr:ornithine cyclodeaminase family protein [Candidatus Rokubacteria bacterium]